MKGIDSEHQDRIQYALVTIIKRILEEKDVTIYRLAKDIGEDRQRIASLVEKGERMDKMCELIAKLRDYSGHNWATFGKMIDDLYLKKKD